MRRMPLQKVLWNVSLFLLLCENTAKKMSSTKQGAGRPSLHMGTSGALILDLPDFRAVRNTRLSFEVTKSTLFCYVIPRAVSQIEGGRHFLKSCQSFSSWAAQPLLSGLRSAMGAGS